MSIAEGWNALRNRQIGQAEEHFRANLETSPVVALAGLIRIRLMTQRADEAVLFAQNLLELDRSAMSLGLLGESIGTMGRRGEAEGLVNHGLESEPNNGWLLALRGEQKIRRAKWEDGAEDIVKALSNDATRPQAFTHVVSVFFDLCRAVAAKKVEPERAIWLVNHIEQSCPPYPELRFLPIVRRALASKQGIPANERPLPVFPMEGAPPTRREAAVVTSQPASMPDLPNSAASNSVRRSAMQTHASSGAQPPPIFGRMSGTKVPPLARLMAEDRSENEKLQGGVTQLGLPLWPSESTKIDTIPNLRPMPLNNDMRPIRNNRVAVTTGSVESEILVSRGVEILAEVATFGVARSLSFDMMGISQIEAQCLAGVLQELPPIPEEYNLRGASISTDVLALGAFLGVVCVKRIGAIWRLDHQTEQSFVEAEDNKFLPFALAREWVEAKDKSSVDLYSTMFEFLSQHRGFAINKQADYTAGLKDLALRNRLSELWMMHFPPAAAYPLVEIIDSIDVRASDERQIIFTIPRRHSIDFGQETNTIAYVRSTGDFLLLGYRPHFARFLGNTGLSIKSSAPNLLRLIEGFHFGTPLGNQEPDIRVGPDSATLTLRVPGFQEPFVLTEKFSGVLRWQFVRGDAPSAAKFVRPI